MSVSTLHKEDDDDNDNNNNNNNNNNKNYYYYYYYSFQYRVHKSPLLVAIINYMNTAEIISS